VRVLGKERTVPAASKLSVQFRGKFAHPLQYNAHAPSADHNNNSNQHAYAGATDSFTRPSVLLVLTDRGMLGRLTDCNIMCKRSV
jgi:hypothetical protein